MTDVLIIDSDRGFLSKALRSLSEAGIGVVISSDLREALHLVFDSRPRLILLEWGMTANSAKEFVVGLAKNTDTAGIPVWVFGDGTDEASICDAYLSGVADHIAKPVSLRILVTKVKSFLESRSTTHLQRVTQRLTDLEQVGKDVGRAESNITRLMRRETRIPRLDVGVVYRPQEVIGGDFFDYFQTQRGTFCLILGDVRGHGVEAAVIQTMARKVVQMRLQQALSVEQGLVQANEDLRQDIPVGHFVALVLAEWISEKRTVRLFRLGTPYPLLRRATKVQTADPVDQDAALLQPAQVLVAEGAVMGVSATRQFERDIRPLEFWLESGDLLLLHSDGLVETTTYDGSPFGLDRLRLLLTTVPDGPSQRMVEVIADTVALAAPGGYGDDVTLLGLRGIE